MLNRLLPNSLAYRLLAMTALWTTLALLVTGLILSTVFRTNTQRDFERLLQAHAYNLMGAIDVSQEGSLSGEPDLGDSRFGTPFSGWYWSVATADNPSKPLIHSLSIPGDALDIPPTNEQPFDNEFRRLTLVTDAQGNSIRQLEAQLFVGEGTTLYQVLVAGNSSDIEEAVHEFNKTLLLFFLLFGIGTIVATFFVIRIGLQPLSAATEALHKVREGQADMLEGTYPTEIQPLAAEINALIATNRSIVERARTKVGNLAHAVKTPLAVILNEVRPGKDEKSALIADQAELMKSQVQTYLDRARITAQRNTIVARTQVRPVLAKMLRVMERLAPNITFVLKDGEADPVFRGEQQDLEEILGNLLENASRFARHKVVISIQDEGEGESATSSMTILIEDDGPGLMATERDDALKRGMRLDESQPGSGLGLSIVRDIAGEYGGSFRLDDSALGGLMAVIVLPKLSPR
ncbi:MAG: ATP-binding protein [Rhizobiaceae bacterium]